MRILVTRGAGDKLAPETLIDTLCTTNDIGKEKGSTYLYDEGYNKRLYEMQFPYKGKIYPTDLIAVTDNNLGESFVGRVIFHKVDINMTNNTLSINSTVIVERKEEVI